jgi:hypothetical protein
MRNKLNYNSYKFFNNFKGQIAIFVLIAVLIVFLMVFLMFSKVDSKEDNLELDKDKILLEDDSKLDVLKNKIDHCLSMQLKRATIVSGLRGGFIYDEGEYYFPGTIASESYSRIFISNMDLNWNFLRSGTLVHSHAQVYTPGVDENVFMYEHSIREDMQRFVMKGFMKCLNFDDVQGIYGINFTQYVGKVHDVNYNNNGVRVLGFNANLGDKVELEIENEVLEGRVESYDSSTDLYYVKFDDLSSIGNYDSEEVINMEVYNMNNSLNLSVSINEEDITAKISYPVSIERGDFKSFYEDSSVRVDVRYKSLLGIAKHLLTHKYLYNKSIDYSDLDNVARVLNDSVYYKKSEYKDLIFSQKVLIDENERKRYVYSLIDNNSKIMGHPFVLNFAYENIAPTVEFDKISEGTTLSDENNEIVRFMITEGQRINFNLREITYEEQFWDDYIFYFREQKSGGPNSSYEFVLNESGNMSFVAHMEMVYRFNIIVTDGETQREHLIEFITGFPSNVNNSEAESCFNFRNSVDPLNYFMISSAFKNKKYKFIENGYHNVFGLIQFGDSSIPSSDLYFSKSCVFDPSIYNITAHSVDPSGDKTDITSDVDDISPMDYKIRIPQENYVQDIVVEVYNIATGNTMTQPFNFTVYPVSCLGPFSDENIFNGTCCKSDQIYNAVQNTLSNNDSSYIEAVSESNMLKDGNVIIDESMYFCYNPDGDDVASIGAYDYENKVLWDLHPSITSLFEADVLIQCQGVYPRPVHNFKRIGGGGGVNFGTLNKIKSDGLLYENNNGIAANLNVAESADKCEFCYLYNITPVELIFNKSGELLAFEMGLVSANDGSGGILPPAKVDAIPDSTFPDWSFLSASDQNKYNNLDVLCEDSWFGKLNASSDWSLIGFPFGNGGSRQTSEISKGYCYQGASTCSGASDTPTHSSVGDGQCIDRYFVNYDTQSFQFNSGWRCGTTDVSCPPNNDCDECGTPNTQMLYCDGTSSSCPAKQTLVCNCDASCNN